MLRIWWWSQTTRRRNWWCEMLAHGHVDTWLSSDPWFGSHSGEGSGRNWVHGLRVQNRPNFSPTFWAPTVGAQNCVDNLGRFWIWSRVLISFSLPNQNQIHDWATNDAQGLLLFSICLVQCYAKMKSPRTKTVQIFKHRFPNYVSIAYIA